MQEHPAPAIGGTAHAQAAGRCCWAAAMRLALGHSFSDSGGPNRGRQNLSLQICHLSLFISEMANFNGQICNDKSF
jgi:hypothetical protein